MTWLKLYYENQTQLLQTNYYLEQIDSTFVFHLFLNLWNVQLVNLAMKGQKQHLYI